MKLNLIESADRVGIFTECKTVIKDRDEVKVDRAGTLVLTTTMPSGSSVQRRFKANNGLVILNDFDIIQGTSHVEFIGDDGAKYKCGEIHRNGRFIHYKSNSDELLATLSVAYLEQKHQIEQISKEISVIKNKYGISIV